MIWVAKLKDGSIVKQHDGLKLDKSEVESFRITESSGDSTVHFSADSGIIRFTNLNYQKICELSGGEEIKLIFDKENEVFRLDEKSLNFVDNIVLRDEKTYFYIEFDQTGKFYVEGRPFYMAFKSGETYNFTDRPPYDDFNYTISAYDDFYMGNGAALKKLNFKSKYLLGYKKTYTFKDLEFDVKHTLVFDVLKGYVLHESTITINQNISGSLITYFGDSRESMPVEFTKGSTKRFKKVLTLV